MSEKRDLENGTTTTETRTLYPMMLENPQLRWSFIRKVYSIITFQLLLTIVVASVVVFVPPIAHFFVSSTQGLILYIVLIFVPFISMCLVLYIYDD
jgi:FtsH-binding integral membrane protein